MWGSATRRKEMKERRKGSRIFLFSKKVFWKSGTGSTHEREEDQILRRKKGTKSREGEIGKKGGFSEGTFQHT